jgi:hypothetical protein
MRCQLISRNGHPFSEGAWVLFPAKDKSLFSKYLAELAGKGARRGNVAVRGAEFELGQTSLDPLFLEALRSIR